MKKYQTGRIDVISMGCSKNLIDSERLICQVEAKGYHTVFDSESPIGEYVVVNTCGFISDAKIESINLLLNLIERKKKGLIGNIIGMGCLSERYKKELPDEIPEIEHWYGKFNWTEFIESLPSLLPSLNESKAPESWERKLTTLPHHAYIKISEGCNRFCAFCAIPIITGRHKSRPEEEILREVKSLVNKGVKEFNVIAQDLSSYGTDLYGHKSLASLIDKMAGIPGVKWIRLHYAYPADFPMDIIDVMARRDNVCKYLDIALQHISDPVLKNMRRNIDATATISLLNEIRNRVPGIKIRTTLMVGFPGETQEAYDELIDFVKQQKFDRMGAFSYSEEDDTFAAKNFSDIIDESTKQARLDKLMEVQQEIALKNAESLIGKTIKLIVDSREGDYLVCRSEWDSPEVDCSFYVLDDKSSPGEFISAKVIDVTSPYDLIAEKL